MKHIHQVMVRGLDSELARKIRKLADDEGISLNKAALRLLTKGAGLEREEDDDAIGDDLDHLLGTWSDAQAEEFAAALKSMSEIDPEMWE